MCLGKDGCLFEREGFARFPVKFVKFAESYLGIACLLLYSDWTYGLDKKKGANSAAP